ncbi:MAG: hypothetical protein SFV51_07525, partial [Bryobacteraceae bacterium]|nr:hypothetical protein [Bryobacteraceae bacterium]
GAMEECAVQVLVNTFFEERLENLFNLAGRVSEAFESAGLDYRVIGGVATYLYVEEAAPDAGRLTRDVDIMVRREDMDRIAEAVKPYGLEYRHVAGVDMLVQSGQPSARRAVHMVFAGEKVRPADSLALPDLGPGRTIKGLRLVPLADLVRMKLTSFRLKDQTHIKDLEEAGLITPEVEADLPPVLRDRLAQVKAHD